MDKIKIFLIDDEEDFCFFVKQNLSLSGEFSVSYATDPDKGIAMVRKEPPALILMDIMMPKKDGLKALEILKKDRRTVSVPIIMVTALGDENTRLKASHLFGEDYIVKPVTAETLKTKIDEVLNRQRKLKWVENKRRG